MGSKKKKDSRIPRIRRTWIRNPAEQVVPNDNKDEKTDKRRLRDEALEEYEGSSGDSGIPDDF